ASTQAEDLQNAVAVPLPSSRPADAIGQLALAALPASVSALPQAAAYAAPEPAAPAPSAAPLLETAGFAPAPEEILPEASVERTATVAASPKMVLAARAPGSDPTAVLGGVKTTAKSARPGVADTKPEPTPVVLAAQPATARWALDGNYIANNSEGTKAPSYANKIVYSAPREVYTAGFQQANAQPGDTNRFTGKAVTFLSVARFN
ncbi:peptidase M15, partial [Rhizobiaceae sp. 2RAB30]